MELPRRSFTSLGNVIYNYYNSPCRFHAGRVAFIIINGTGHYSLTEQDNPAYTKYGDWRSEAIVLDVNNKPCMYVVEIRDRVNIYFDYNCSLHLNHVSNHLDPHSMLKQHTVQLKNVISGFKFINTHYEESKKKDPETPNLLMQHFPDDLKKPINFKALTEVVIHNKMMTKEAVEQIDPRLTVQEKIDLVLKEISKSEHLLMFIAKNSDRLVQFNTFIKRVANDPIWMFLILNDYIGLCAPTTERGELEKKNIASIEGRAQLRVHLIEMHNALWKDAVKVMQYPSLMSFFCRHYCPMALYFTMARKILLSNKGTCTSNIYPLIFEESNNEVDFIKQVKECFFKLTEEERLALSAQYHTVTSVDFLNLKRRNALDKLYGMGQPEPVANPLDPDLVFLQGLVQI